MIGDTDEFIIRVSGECRNGHIIKCLADVKFGVEGGWSGHYGTFNLSFDARCAQCDQAIDLSDNHELGMMIAAGFSKRIEPHVNAVEPTPCLHVIEANAMCRDCGMTLEAIVASGQRRIETTNASTREEWR